jgi:hypothetical protein
MKTINCDINHMEHGIKMLNNSDNDIKYLSVWDTDCVMRGISREEMQERNIHATDPDEICKIEYSSYNSFRFHFYESMVEIGKEFTFSPHIPSNFTSPEELGDKLGEVVDQLGMIFGFENIAWDFVGVKAQSYMQNGHLGSYEFEYDLIVY